MTSATAPTARARPRTRTCAPRACRSRASAGRERVDLYLLRVTDERVPDTDKKFFTFPLSIHGIERAGAEAGVRAAEDLATWAACEAGTATAPVTCAKEGAIPHPLLETTPAESVTAGEALRRSAVYFVFANPDGWRRGDLDNGVRFFQRYNGNGVDMNRDWPTIGFTFQPYTPWSEPETARVRQGAEADPAEVGRRHRPARPADRPRVLVHAARRGRARLREEPAHPADGQGRLGRRRAAARLVAADQAEHARRRTTSGSTASSGARSGTRSPTRRPARSATGSTRRSGSTPTGSTTR